MTNVDVRLSALEGQIADTVHIQQAINNKLFSQMGIIEGKQGEDDQEINSLLTHDLKDDPPKKTIAH